MILILLKLLNKIAPIHYKIPSDISSASFIVLMFSENSSINIKMGTLRG